MDWARTEPGLSQGLSRDELGRTCRTKRGVSQLWLEWRRSTNAACACAGMQRRPRLSCHWLHGCHRQGCKLLARHLQASAPAGNDPQLGDNSRPQ